MKKMLLLILCACCFLTGCQKKVIYNLTEEQIQQVCIDELTKYYNPDSAESPTVSIENLRYDWLCDIKGKNSYQYKVICSFDIVTADYTLTDHTAMVNFSYGTHDRLLIDSEVTLVVLN